MSASTGNVVHALDTRTGKEVGRFPSGDSPHENNYSADGSRIFHASIGLVYTPADEPALDATKGERYFQVVDGRNYRVLKRAGGEKLREAGYPNMSSAVRPMAIAPDERHSISRSFFHGFVEYDLRRDKVLRVAHLPVSDEAKQLRREQHCSTPRAPRRPWTQEGEAVRGGHDVGLRGDCRLMGPRSATA